MDSSSSTDESEPFGQASADPVTVAQRTDILKFQADYAQIVNTANYTPEKADIVSLQSKLDAYKNFVLPDWLREEEETDLDQSEKLREQLLLSLE